MLSRPVVRLLILLAVANSRAALLHAQIDDLPPSPITGTLTFLGCTPSPADFELYGVPMILETERHHSDGVPNLPVVRGILSTTDDPHVMSVSLPAVQDDFAYQLRIVALRSNPCGRIFWEGPDQGIAMPGDQVRLLGYSPRSQIEVLARQVGSAPRRGWVGAETIDVQNIFDATRQIRWATELPGITRGLIQVSTEEFPKQDTVGRTSCASAPGVIYQTTFAAQTGVWNMAPVLNYAAIAAQVAFSGPSGVQRYNLFTYGAPLYVRVVPLRGSVPVCNFTDNGPMPWVVLANAGKAGGTKFNTFASDPSQGPPPAAQIELGSQSSYTAPWFWDHPKAGETAYRVVHEHKIPDECLFPVSCPSWDRKFVKFTEFGPNDTIPEQYLFWFKPGSGFSLGDVFEGAASIVTGAIDAVGFVVNNVSKAYEAIKKAVVKVAVQAISATGLVNCEQSEACQELVKTALNTGLAAMGVPPSLPNWNDIVNHGYEYLAAEIVTQAGVGGVPGAQDLTEAAAKTLVEETASRIHANRGGGGDLPKWLAIDLGENPAVLTLQLRTYGQVGTPLFPNYLKLSGNAAFLGTAGDVPSKWPQLDAVYKAITIPIVLRPELDGFVPPKLPFGLTNDYLTGVAAKAFWKAKLVGLPCVKTDSQLLVKSGPLFITSTYSIPSLTFGPNWDQGFPPFQSCVP